MVRSGERVHLTHLHGTRRWYRARPLALRPVAVSVAVSLTVRMTVSVSMTMAEALNRSTRVKRMIPTIRGRALGGWLLLRGMVMTPRIQSFSVQGNVLEQSGPVLVIPATYFDTSKRNERIREKEREKGGDLIIRLSDEVLVGREGGVY